MIPEYKFFLDNGNGLGQRVVHPIWKDDMALEYSYESNQMFKRAQLSGNLIFVGADYDYIMSTVFYDEIELEVLVSYDNGGVWSSFYTGIFHLTDCEVNVDDKKITVKPQIKDRYSKVLAGLDKEYDLIKLKPAMQPVTLIRRPMIQVYVPGDSIVTCYLSNMTWEQDCTEEESSLKLENDFHFGQVGIFMEVTFSPTSETVTAIGAYPDVNFDGEIKLDCSAHQYIVKYFQTDAGQTNGIRVYSGANPDMLLWEFSQTYLFRGLIPDSFVLEARRTGYTNKNASALNTSVYARLCLALSQINGQDTYDIPQDDIVPYNRNYRKCFPYGISNLVDIVYQSQVDPSEWGIRPDGKYYTKPELPTGVIDYLPVARINWNYASLWFRQTSETEALEVSGRKETQLRDAFTLEAVLTALLGEVDNTVTFAATTDHSQFLYGTNPLMTSGWGRLVMTPKSNVLVAEYTQPARKAPVTLGQVLNMLRDVCGCYWFIDSQNRLVIEHISWFKNGGSYVSSQVVGLDITTKFNSRNGKPVSYGTNKYKYEKAEMPERYEYEWMDDSTDIFKGEAIEVLSSFVDEGQVEEITVDAFNADIDYMMLNPSNVSEDGFALMCVDNAWKTTIADVLAAVNKVQNWQLSFSVLQPNFLISDMPSWNIKVNGAAVTAKGIQRKKTQEVSVPLGLSSLNTDLMVKTGIGTGEIKSASMKLSSRMVKLNLVYDTTEQ